MKAVLDDPTIISLAAGFTANEILPLAPVQSIVNTIIDQPARGQNALQYGSTIGRNRLRQSILTRISEQDQLTLGPNGWDESQVAVTTGSQELLYLLGEILLDPDDYVLLELPTYFVFMGILHGLGAKGHSIPTSPDGLDIDALDRTLKVMEERGTLERLKFFYLVSYHQNPTGYTLPFENKRAVHERMDRVSQKLGRPVFIIEDAAYRDLGFHGDAPRSLLSIDQGKDLVVYTSTFCKPFSSGLKLGYGILPRLLADHLLRQKGNLDFGSSNFTQAIIEEALENGAYQEQAQVCSRRYQEKMEIMAEALQQQLPSDVSWQKPGGGLYIWATLPSHIPTSMNSPFFDACLRRKVLYVPGDLCCFPDEDNPSIPHSSIRLSFGAASPEQITEGIARLGQAYQDISSASRSASMIPGTF
jgi:2-aminoadipate transaminase